MKTSKEARKTAQPKPQAARSAAAMLPADEQQGGFAQEETGHQTLVLRGPSKKEKTVSVKATANASPSPSAASFSSPFGANEDKARSRGYHQQSAKDASGFGSMPQMAKTAKKEKMVVDGGKGAANATSSAKTGAPATPAVPADEEKITRTTLIMDIVYKFPEAVPVLTEAGLHCIGCQLSVYDDFQTGCAIHGFDEQTINELVIKMNEAVQAGRAPAAAKSR